MGGGTDGVLQSKSGKRRVLGLGRWGGDWNLDLNRWANDWNSDKRFLAAQQERYGAGRNRSVGKDGRQRRPSF